MLSLFAGAAFAADDVASAVAGKVKAVDNGTKTVVVKTSEGTEHTVHFVKRTVEHGADATSRGRKDAFQDVKEGDSVVIHYTVKGTEKTAEEVDHVGKGGVKMSEVAIKSVDQGAESVTVKTAEGGEETFHMADRAARESGKGLEKAGKVTVYYSEEAGKKIAHFFK